MQGRFSGRIHRAVTRAEGEGGLTKGARCHTFGRTIVTPLLEEGKDIRAIQELLGNQDVSTTMLGAIGMPYMANVVTI
jgi:site-specific recombinase XerD